MIRTRSQQKGFTLVELLVVIGIMGLIGAVVIPQLTKFMGRGDSEAQAAELDIVYIAVAATMADQDPSIGNLGAENDSHDSSEERTNDMTAGGLLATLDVSRFIYKSTTAYYYWVDDYGRVYQHPDPP